VPHDARAKLFQGQQLIAPLLKAAGIPVVRSVPVKLGTFGELYPTRVIVAVLLAKLVKDSITPPTVLWVPKSTIRLAWVPVVDLQVLLFVSSLRLPRDVLPLLAVMVVLDKSIKFVCIILKLFGDGILTPKYYKCIGAISASKNLVTQSYFGFIIS
jgi:hypothetical protein